MNGNTHKTCSKCGVAKPVSEFSSSGYRRKDGTLTRKASCKACCSEYQREYIRCNREQVRIRSRESRRQWRERNPSKDKECAARWRKNHPFAAKLVSVQYYAKKHGYKPCTATVKEIEAAFSGKCDICGVPEVECATRLHLDHDHSTGVFRGWLCGSCNKALGMLKDSEDVLINALHYLMANAR